MKRAALLAFLGSLFLCGSASSQPAVGTYFVRASIGLASQSLKDWNDDIDALNRSLNDAGIPSSFDNFGGAIPFGIEAGYQLKPALGLSVGVFRQSDSADNTYSDFSGSLTMDSEAAMTAVTAGVSYWLPETPGVFLAGDVGVGFGTAKRSFVFRDYTTPSNNLDVAGDWSGNGIVAGLCVGYQLQYSTGFLLHGRLGYRFQNLGEFDGDETSPQFGSASGAPESVTTGQSMDTDFSGVQFLVGIGFAFGGK